MNSGPMEIVILVIIADITAALVVGIISLLRRSQGEWRTASALAAAGWLSDPTQRRQDPCRDGSWTSSVHEAAPEPQDPLP